ncbi:protocadherin Fat 1-like [Mercenaria mercenaria]|uniref:protocadherin Fat 1-like n=1 Tax=Mercenaria mercenaria TaxID=6596 RepID=UPI001E1D9A92|nr:protocadherin Fat 1-like [Mercenaria mercenaria]
MLTKVWIFVILCCAALYATDAQITGWAVPSINGASGTGATAITFPENQATGATSTTFSATPTSPDTIASYTLVTSGTPFSIASSTGVLTLDSALDFETTATYILKIKAVDNNGTPNSGTATVTITVTDIDDTAPTFSDSSYTACVADASTAGQSVTTLTATDQDAGTVTYSISSGNTNSHFKFSAAQLQVNTGATLDQSTTASYTLIVHAVDDDTPANTATTTVTVTVGDCSSATAMTFSVMTILVALVVSLH